MNTIKLTKNGRPATREEFLSAAGIADPLKEHTPGPWKVQSNMNPTGDCVILCDKTNAFGNYHIAEVSRGPNYKITDQDKANARLIAAAPELMKALRYLEEVAIAKVLPNASHPAMQQARAAISKATAE